MNKNLENFNINLLIENSTKNENKIVEKLLQETNVSADVASWPSLITDVIERTQSISVVPLITSVIPSPTPSGKIPVASIRLTGKEEDTENTAIVLEVADETVFTVGGDITSAGGGEGTVLYTEPSFVLVEVTAGSFVAGEGLDNANPYSASETTITNIYSSIFAVGKILENYVGEYATADLEETDVNRIEFLVKLLEVTAKGRSLRTGMTMEATYDLARQYGKDFYQKLVEIISSAIVISEESQCFTKMKEIATIESDLVLSNSYGTNTSLDKIFMDIVSGINKFINQIGTNTNMSSAQFFVIASSNVAGAIKTATPVKPFQGFNNMNHKVVGTLMDGTLLIEDSYALEDYYMVGSAGFSGANNAGMIYNPYSYDIIQVTNSKTLQSELAVKERCSFNRNPLDTKTGTSSDFFRYQKVDFTTLSNY